MSIAWIDYVLKSGPADPTQRFVLVAIADCAHDDGHGAYPSLPALASKTQYSESTIRRAIASLEAGGWLTVIRGNGSGNKSLYTLQRVSERTPSKKSKGITVEPFVKGVIVTAFTPNSQQNDIPVPMQRVSLVQEGYQPETLPKRVSLCAIKGVTVQEPPHPLKGVTVIEPSGEAVIPEWLNSESWNGFVAHRKEIKKPVTGHCLTLTIRKLSKWRDMGYDPNAIIDTTVENGWRGLWLPKGPDGQPLPPPKKKKVFYSGNTVAEWKARIADPAAWKAAEILPEDDTGYVA